MRPVLLVAAASILGFSPAAWANVVLMAGQQAQPLGGSFNSVPVLHSNQPEEVAGPGILVSTSSGEGLAENGQSLAHATYTFNGDFGLHAHHKYFPSDSARLAELQQTAKQHEAVLLQISGAIQEYTMVIAQEESKAKGEQDAPNQVDDAQSV